MFPKGLIFTALVLANGLAHAAPTARVGDATWFSVGLGACGNTKSDEDFIVAISATLYDSFADPNDRNPNKNPVCGRQITATTTDGKSVTVTVQDRCVGCAEDDIDLSPAAFSVLADLGVGRLPGVRWAL